MVIIIVTILVAVSLLVTGTACKARHDADEHIACLFKDKEDDDGMSV